MSYDVIFVCQDGQRLAPARVRCYHFADVLERHGLKTRVFSYVDHLGASDAYGGGPYLNIPEYEKLRLNGEAMKFLLQYPNSVFFMQKLGYHYPAVLGAAAVNGNPIVFDYDDFDIILNGYPALANVLPSFNPLFAFKDALGVASEVTVSSRELQKLVKEQGVDSTFIPTGPDLKRFAYDETKPLFPPHPEGKVRIWWGGEIWGEAVVNNVLRVFSAIADMPEDFRKKVEFVICGFGCYYDSFSMFVTQHYASKFDISILGAYAGDEMPAFIKSMDIGVVPLNGRNPFDQCKSPTKMFELMAMERAVVAERCGEPGQIIQDGVNGFLANTTFEWTAKLSLLIQSAELRHQIGRKAREDVETKYSIESQAGVLTDIIKRAARNPAPALLNYRKQLAKLDEAQKKMMMY